MTLLSNPTVVIHHTPSEPDYPATPPFHPPQAYPEFPEGHPARAGSDPTNQVYPAVRETLLLLGLDAAHAGTPDWNPLGDLIHPGDQVLLKPNLVQERNGFSYDARSVTTHGAVVRAVADYALLALRGRGKLIIGDAPLQKADMAKILQVNGLGGVIETYAQFGDSHPEYSMVTFMDFRLKHALTAQGMVLRQEDLDGASGGYLAVNLGNESFLDAVSGHYQNFRVTDYVRAEMPRHHNPETHEYLLPRLILESDVVINLPKLKTHRKVGLTAALKNLIGINGHKDWLPHHSNYSAAEGGDEYQYPSGRKRLDTWLDERVDEARWILPKYALRLGRLGLRLSERLVRPADPYKEGSWWGNDTLWRTVLDLNRILLYADRQGNLTPDPQRRCLTLVDAWLAGEGEGPLEPTPHSCGLLLAGFNPVLVDWAAAHLVGFDPERIPLIRQARQSGFFHAAAVPEIRSNEARWSAVLNWSRAESLKFQPSKGWVGHIELK